LLTSLLGLFATQNLVSHRAAYQPDDSTRVYTVPYIIDTAAANEMAGIRVHWPVVSANSNNVQMVDDFKNGISLGTTDKDVSAKYKVDDKEPLSHLGVSLKWGDKEKSMKSHIVRGMPFGTVQYVGGVLPSLYSYNGPASDVLVDDDKELKCGVMEGKAGPTMQVNNEVRLHFVNSDFTWALFFSSPVEISCAVSEGDEKTRQFQLDVVSYDESKVDGPLTVRLALLDQCTTGKSDITQHCLEKGKWKNQKEYEQLLKESASVFPTSPQLDFDYPESDSQEAKIAIDWGARTTIKGNDTEKLLMFAMPHHQDSLKNSSGVKITDQCIDTFHGSTCLVLGDSWLLTENLGSPMSFTAPRPPEAASIPALADALSEDIHYRLSDNMLRGAADTYFSGKILARLGRVIMIASELKQLASQNVEGIYTDVDVKSLSLSVEAAASAELPSDEDIATAVEQLKHGVEIWINGNAEAPYVYDKSWGGLVNCGCTYHGKGDKGVCNNTFPECPALVDVNEDFGNGKFW